MDKRYQLSEAEHSQGLAWHLQAPPTGTTDALNTLAAALRDAGLCGPWRDEQLAVTNPAGEVIGTVERGAVRVLGVATRAVHLVGLAPDGRMWVQKRSLTKPNNPGLWDTLMGGMVSAADSLPQALARETWEEAGLRVTDLQSLHAAGRITIRRPVSEGYMVEHIDVFEAVVPAVLEQRVVGADAAAGAAAGAFSISCACASVVSEMRSPPSIRDALRSRSASPIFLRPM